MRFGMTQLSTRDYMTWMLASIDHCMVLKTERNPYRVVRKNDPDDTKIETLNQNKLLLTFKSLV